MQTALVAVCGAALEHACCRLRSSPPLPQCQRGASALRWREGRGCTRHQSAVPARRQPAFGAAGDWSGHPRVRARGWMTLPCFGGSGELPGTSTTVEVSSRRTRDHTLGALLGGTKAGRCGRLVVAGFMWPTRTNRVPRGANHPSSQRSAFGASPRRRAESLADHAAASSAANATPDEGASGNRGS